MTKKIGIVVLLAVVLGFGLYTRPQEQVLVEDQTKQQFMSECMFVDESYKETTDTNKVKVACECIYKDLMKQGGAEKLQDDEAYIESAFKCLGVEY